MECFFTRRDDDNLNVYRVGPKICTVKLSSSSVKFYLFRKGCRQKKDYNNFNAVGFQF